MLFLKILVFPILIFCANLLVFVRSTAPEDKRYWQDINLLGRHAAATMIAIAIGILFAR